MKRKRIALVAHDNKKKDLIEWIEWNSNVLINHELVCTGTTGRLVEAVLNKKAAETNNQEVEKIDMKTTGGVMVLKKK